MFKEAVDAAILTILVFGISVGFALGFLVFRGSTWAWPYIKQFILWNLT